MYKELCASSYLLIKINPKIPPYLLPSFLPGCFFLFLPPSGWPTLPPTLHFYKKPWKLARWPQAAQDPASCHCWPASWLFLSWKNRDRKQANQVICTSQSRTFFFFLSPAQVASSFLAASPSVPYTNWGGDTAPIHPPQWLQAYFWRELQ